LVGCTFCVPGLVVWVVVVLGGVVVVVPLFDVVPEFGVIPGFVAVPLLVVAFVPVCGGWSFGAGGLSPGRIGGRPA